MTNIVMLPSGRFTVMRDFECKIICIYCGDIKSGDELDCCGESNTHFEEVWFEVDNHGNIINDDTLSYEEVKNILEKQERYVNT